VQTFLPSLLLTFLVTSGSVMPEPAPASSATVPSHLEPSVEPVLQQFGPWIGPAMIAFRTAAEAALEAPAEGSAAAPEDQAPQQTAPIDLGDELKLVRNVVEQLLSPLRGPIGLFGPTAYPRLCEEIARIVLAVHRPWAALPTRAAGCAPEAS